MAAVQETTCKSALVKSGITDFALNPYTGCAHNCVYCYASFMARFSRHEQPWGQWVDVKVNAADALMRDIQRLHRRIDPALFPEESQPVRLPVEIVISSVTDAYQPIERQYRVTRSCLEVLASAALPLKASILTKSDLVTRDIDILKDLPDVEVGMTVTTTDDQVSRRYEPGASPAARRLAALNRIARSGIRTWAFIAPVLPYHSDSPEAMLRLLGALKNAGVSRIAVDRFNPYPAAVGRFLKAAPPEAAQALRDYTAHPDAYLDEVRKAVAQATAHLRIHAEVLL